MCRSDPIDLYLASLLRTVTFIFNRFHFDSRLTLPNAASEQRHSTKASCT
jgi:hypothetical protein